jgi:hypothetical protein
LLEDDVSVPELGVSSPIDVGSLRASISVSPAEDAETENRSITLRTTQLQLTRTERDRLAANGLPRKRKRRLRQLQRICRTPETVHTPQSSRPR